MSSHEDTGHVPAHIEPITNTLGLGKAMRTINPKQRAFVRAFVLTGGSNATRAAIISGYGNTDDSSKAAAYRLVHDPKILAAIKEAADGMLRANILIGSAVLVEIANTPNHKDRFKAAQALLDRGGLIVATQHNANITITEDTPSAQVIDRIKYLADRLGLDPALLLGRDASKAASLPAPADYADAEFEEVYTGSTGLEDLL